MNRLKRYALAAAAIAMLVGAIALFQPAVSHGDSTKDVRVINTPAEPVPVSLQGTVGISGTVQAQQSGVWNVGINGTPTVAIDPLNNVVRLAGGGTKLLLDQDFNNFPTSGQFIPSIDISPYAKIRFSGTVNGSGSIHYWVYSGPTVGGPDTGLRYLDDFSSNSYFTKVYEVAGVSLHIRIDPSDSNNQSILTVYGN